MTEASVTADNCSSRHRTVDDASRLKLLLADIRDVFAKEGEPPAIASADLVKVLVAIEGRPWMEVGRDHKPLTQNRLARILKPLGIGPGFIGPKDARLRGYKISQFEEAFSRYLPQEVCSTVHNAANTGNGGERGLSSRRIQELADLRSEQAYWKFSPADIAAGKLDAWLRDILRKEAPERIELEFERVMQVVRGAR
jgi:hypothetical protein